VLEWLVCYESCGVIPLWWFVGDVDVWWWFISDVDVW